MSKKLKISRIFEILGAYIAYWGSILLLVVIMVYDDSRFFDEASQIIRIIYPQHVISFFEPFYNFYMHIVVCYIFIGFIFIYFFFACLLTDSSKIKVILFNFLLFNLAHYFLLPFIAITFNVFMNSLYPGDNISKSLSYSQIGYSYVYLVFAMIRWVKPVFDGNRKIE